MPAAASSASVPGSGTGATAGTMLAWSAAVARSAGAGTAMPNTDQSEPTLRFVPSAIASLLLATNMPSTTVVPPV